MGYVYFIRMEGTQWVKIGFTEKPRKRLSYIRLVMPKEFVFKLVAAFVGTYEDEKRLHNNFMSDYSQGEWYRSSPRMEELIANTGIPEGITEWSKLPRRSRKFSELKRAVR